MNERRTKKRKREEDYDDELELEIEQPSLKRFSDIEFDSAYVLPYEIWSHIFSFVDKNTILKLRLTSTIFRDITRILIISQVNKIIQKKRKYYKLIASKEGYFERMDRNQLNYDEIITSLWYKLHHSRNWKHKQSFIESITINAPIIENKVISVWKNRQYIGANIDSTLPLGVSKFGGLPHLPPNFIWPTDHYFVAQIRCKDILPYDFLGLMPERGIIFYFAGLNKEGKIFHFDNDETNCLQITTNPNGQIPISTYGKIPFFSFGEYPKNYRQFAEFFCFLKYNNKKKATKNLEKSNFSLLSIKISDFSNSKMVFPISKNHLISRNYSSVLSIII